MPSCKIARSLLLLAFCSTAVLTQAETTVPNTFEDGTPAEASEVNENFDALAGAIDEGLGGRLVIKSGEDVLGYALDSDTFVTRQGYHTTFRNLEVESLNQFGRIVSPYGGVYFTSLDCSGPAHVQDVTRTARAGLVFTDGVEYWVIPLTSTVQLITHRSYRAPGAACRNSPGTGETLNVIPNDPAVTGIQNKGSLADPYPWPIYYEVR